MKNIRSTKLLFYFFELSEKFAEKKTKAQNLFFKAKIILVWTSIAFLLIYLRFVQGSIAVIVSLH